MQKYFGRFGLLLGGLLLISLLLVACGGDVTPTPPPPTATSAPASPTPAPATEAPTTAPAPTATPVVLANLPPGTPAGANLGAPPTAAITRNTPTPVPVFGTVPAGSANPAATPQAQYNPAPLSAFTLKKAADFGLTQDNVRRAENLLIVTGNLPPGNQPGTVEGIILIATSWKIAMPFVWCEDTKDKLDAAWANFSFSMMLDDQPVDLKPFKEADFDDSGTPCRTLDVVLARVPQGLHHLIVTRTVKNAFETGSNGRKVATGDYTYDIALVSFAPNPNPSKPAALSEFKLGSATGPNATYARPAESFYYYSDWQEQYKPGTAKFTAVLFADQPYGVMGGWCAKDQPTLEENWKKMTYSASINGQAINLSNVPTTDNQQGSQYCRQWDLMMTPPEGQHQITVKLNFSADTNDGTTTYPAGDYITEYTLISLKLGNQP